MRSSRIATVYALMTVLVGGTLFDMATDREHWPLSPYPMFANVERERTLSLLRVVAVPLASRSNPPGFPLIDPRFIQPFDQCRLSLALDGDYRDPARRTLVPLLLHDVLRRYEAMRAAGKHHGPRLQAVRLYEMRWRLDPQGQNVDTPDTATLLAEATE